MTYIHIYISDLHGTRGPRRLLKLVRRLLALEKLHEGLDKLDPCAEHLIQLKVVEGLEEEPVTVARSSSSYSMVDGVKSAGEGRMPHICRSTSSV
jgi:hypothetical protein